MAQLDQGGFILKRMNASTGNYDVTGWIYTEIIDLVTSIEHWVVVINPTVTGEIAWDPASVPGTAKGQEVQIFRDAAAPPTFGAWLTALRPEVMAGNYRYYRCDCQILSV